MVDTRKASRLFSGFLTCDLPAYPGPKQLPILLVASLLVLSLIPTLSLGLARGSPPVGPAQVDFLPYTDQHAESYTHISSHIDGIAHEHAHAVEYACTIDRNLDQPAHQG